MREQGLVVELVSPGIARVAMDAAGHAQCGSCGLCRRSGRQLLIDVHTDRSLNVGDRVLLEIPTPNAAISGLLLLFVPLVMFIAGILIGEWLRNRGTLHAGTWASVLIGFVLMVLAFGCAGLYDRKLQRSPDRQARIVDEPEPPEEINQGG